LLLNPLAPAASPVRKADPLPVWADSMAEWVAVASTAAAEWVAEASTAVVEWAAVAFMAVEWVADMVAVAGTAKTLAVRHSRPCFVRRYDLNRGAVWGVEPRLNL